MTRFTLAMLLAIGPSVCFAASPDQTASSGQGKTGDDYLHFCYAAGVPYSLGSEIKGPDGDLLICTQPSVIDTLHPNPVEWNRLLEMP